MIRRILLATALAIVVFMTLPFYRTPYLIVTHLPTGWFHFLQRTLSDVSWNWSGAGMVLLCSFVILAVAHYFLRWFYSSLRGDKQTGIPSQWPLSWTVTLYAMLWIFFGIVMGASGLEQHVTWLREFNGPFKTERISEGAVLRMASLNMDMALDDSQLQKDKVIKAFNNNERESSRSTSPRSWETLRISYFDGPAGKLAGVIITPRNLRSQKIYGFVYFEGDKQREFAPINELPAIIAKLEAARTNTITKPTQ